MKPPWTVKQFADEWCVSRSTVRLLWRSGALPSYTVGRTRFFRDEDVQTYWRTYAAYGSHAKVLAAWAKEPGASMILRHNGNEYTANDRHNWFALTEEDKVPTALDVLRFEREKGCPLSQAIPPREEHLMRLGWAIARCEGLTDLGFDDWSQLVEEVDTDTGCVTWETGRA